MHSTSYSDESVSGEKSLTEGGIFIFSKGEKLQYSGKERERKEKTPLFPPVKNFESVSAGSIFDIARVL